MASCFSFTGNFLSSAQSAPNLPSATTTVANANTTNVAGTHTVASTLSSVLATSLTSTSSESDNEFLESCRASSLLAELEDDEFCQPEELDDENEDDSEGDDYDECTVRNHIIIVKDKVGLKWCT